ncbi:MAG: hypothetical protein HOE53_00980 [Candidatus Magasanikbacteria bacterium]|jgi:hypothetical protein|nr:hypothetical protein [Candidatus Magasanikbacteria bacterium]
MSPIDQLHSLLAKEGIEQWFENDIEKAGELLNALGGKEWEQVQEMAAQQTPEWQVRLLSLLSEEDTKGYGLPIALALLMNEHQDVAAAAIDAFIDHPSFSPSENIMQRITVVAAADQGELQWAVEQLQQRCQDPMQKSILKWDVYQISSKNPLKGVMLRGRIRKTGLLAGMTVLTENAADEDNTVRFALLEDTDPSPIITFLQSIDTNISVEKIQSGLQNPVLSKMKCNIEDRYTV